MRSSGDALAHVPAATRSAGLPDAVMCSLDLLKGRWPTVSAGAGFPLTTKAREACRHVVTGVPGAVARWMDRRWCPRGHHRRHAPSTPPGIFRSSIQAGTHIGSRYRARLRRAGRSGGRASLVRECARRKPPRAAKNAPLKHLTRRCSPPSRTKHSNLRLEHQTAHRHTATTPCRWGWLRTIGSPDDGGGVTRRRLTICKMSPERWPIRSMSLVPRRPRSGRLNPAAAYVQQPTRKMSRSWSWCQEGQKTP
jgi:hypothetical protein